MTQPILGPVPARRDAARRRLALAIACAALASGCAHATRGGPTRSLDLPDDDEVVFVEGARGAGERVAQVLPDALAAGTSRWGDLRDPLRVEVLPDPASLEEAVDRKGYAWLRAWARRSEVWLQAPSTWGLLGASDAALRELLGHELTHVVMYQRAAHEDDWRRRQIPIWFREGMASWTARQGYRRTKLPDIAAWLRDHPGEDPVAGADAMYRDSDGLVYAAGHHAFAFLVDRYGLPAVKALMARMYATGETFPEAFEETIGISMEDFEAEFKRFVRLEGWRRPDSSRGHP